MMWLYVPCYYAFSANRMYISLYTAKQLRNMKDRMLWLGLFMSSGGAASVLYNMLLAEQARWHWALAALVVLVAGLLLMIVGAGIVQFNTAYFSISPSQISYRLHFYSPKQTIEWRQVSGVQLCDTCVLFDLQGGRQKALRFMTFQSSNIAGQVSASIQVAALERNITVNGVRFDVPSPTTKHPFV